jgi:hypothetical protein
MYEIIITYKYGEKARARHRGRTQWGKAQAEQYAKELSFNLRAMCVVRPVKSIARQKS